jgi:hypothetical protein
MKLSDDELAYLDSRQALARRWTLIGSLLLLAIGGVLTFLWVHSPLLVNPWRTAELVAGQHVPPLTLAEMAVKLPVVFLICCVLLVALVLFQFAAIGQERRLLKIIRDRIEGDDPR